MNLRTLIFGDRYEEKSLLQEYLRSQYGPFLKAVPKYEKSELFYKTLLAEAKPYIKSESDVLDIGCALGRMVFEYEKMGAGSACGIDSSRQFIAEANRIKNGEEEGLEYPVPPHSVTEFIQADASKLSFPDGFFSLISCINVLDRVKDPSLLALEMQRLLKRGGALLISMPYDWERSLSSRKFHVKDVKTFFPEKFWRLEKETRDVPYTVPIGKKFDRTYLCHALLLKKIV